MNEAQFEAQFAEFARQSAEEKRFTPRREDWLPILGEDGEQGGWCFIYAMHTGWACRVLMETKPRSHVDISSMVYFAAMGSAIVQPFTFLDLRPVRLPLPGLRTDMGDILNLPYETDSLESISCMHVMEHIGLGRYGDPIDAQGDLKAAKELQRVLKPGGQMIMVLPVNQTPLVVFNAHRYYTYDMIMQMFPDMRLQEFALIGNRSITRHADRNSIRNVKAREYEDCGCFHFIKR